MTSSPPMGPIRRAGSCCRNSPPDRDVHWTEQGVQGAQRFMQRVWRLTNEVASLGTGGNGAAPTTLSAASLALRKVAHRALAGVENGIERIHFNVCVAQAYELASALQDALAGTRDGGEVSADMRFALSEAAHFLVQAVAPFMPHLAEECWRALGHADLVADAPWPETDRSLLVDDEVTMPVQVNGKLRAHLTAPRDADTSSVETAALALEAVQRAIEGRPVKKVIIVPQRIVNVVV